MMSYKKLLLPCFLVFFLGNEGVAWSQKALNLSNNAGSSSSSKVALQGSNIFVVWEDNELGNLNLEIFFRRSTNGGKTFSPNVNLSNLSGDSVNAQVAAAGDNVYVVWSDFNVGIGDIFFRRSTDGGATFDSAQNLRSNSNPSLFPQVATDGTNVYVVWQEAIGGNSEIFFRRSTDGGVTFDAAQNLSNNAGLSMFPQIVLSDGNIYVGWEDDTPGDVDIFFSRSTDGGVSFSAAQNLSSNDGSSQNFHLGAGAGNVYVVWDDFTDFDNTFGDVLYRRSTDGGATFGSTVNLSNTPEGFSQFPRIAVNGVNVFVVWEDDNPGNVDILLRRSTDGGANFEAAKNVSNTLGTSVNPRIATLGTKVAVAWEDDTAGHFDVLLNSSANQGQTFAKKATNFTKKSSGTAENASLVIQPGKTPGTAGKSIVVWEQDIPSTVNRDIFLGLK